MTTWAGGEELPSTARSAMAGLLPLVLLAAGWPPVAIRYRDESAPAVPGASSEKRPSAPACVCASCFGSLALAAHNVTVELAIGAHSKTLAMANATATEVLRMGQFTTVGTLIGPLLREEELNLDPQLPGR